MCRSSTLPVFWTLCRRLRRSPGWKHWQRRRHRLAQIPAKVLCYLVVTVSPALTAIPYVLCTQVVLAHYVLARLSFASLRFAIRTIPVAETYSSRHPQLPQLQGSVSSSLTCICPISPAAPVAPATILPLMIIPPPTPVPRVTTTTSSYPFCAALPGLAQCCYVGVITSFYRQI